MQKKKYRKINCWGDEESSDECPKYIDIHEYLILEQKGGNNSNEF